MSELKDQLAAEAKRQEPGQQPPFSDLVRRRRRRDGRNLAAVGSAVVVALAVAVGPVLLRRQPAEVPAASDVVVVTGVLLAVGGPIGAGTDGLPGTLWFEAADGTMTSATAADDGRFSINVSPGKYTVSGSPAFLESASPSASADMDAKPGADVNGPSPVVTTPWCRASAPVVVTGNGLRDVQVLCQRR